MSRTYLRILFLVSLITILQTISTIDATPDVNCTQKPQLINPRHCCAVPNLVTAEIRRKCLQKRHEHWHSISTHRRPYRYRNRRHFKRSHVKQMYWSCVLNETGIIANGTLQQYNLTEYLHKITDDANIIPIVVQSFDFCMNFNYNNVNATHHQHHPHNHHHSHHLPHSYSHNYPHNHNHFHGHNRLPRSCTHRHHRQHQRERHRRYRLNSNRNRYIGNHWSSANETNARRLIICVYQETFINCPHKSWNNTDVCNAKRDYIQHCRVHNVTLPVLTTSTDAPPPLPMPIPQPTPSNADDNEDQDDQLGYIGEENAVDEMTDDDDDDDDDENDEDDDYNNYNSYTNNDAGLNGGNSGVHSLYRDIKPSPHPKPSPYVTQPQSEYHPDIDVRFNV